MHLTSKRFAWHMIKLVPS